ncbi:hypothetical protein KL864_34060 [Mycolicibacterium goodii]|uniref:hypothetical protein n=1 Tax=Mycolicibacterium goodii TaxID=134601 RepID=UPI001BDC8DC8|nr:hypothetical protein [Mycolicibacterium goodii]MBU8820892.1 hypothetical protein [Mycolicibacterium goodii]
MHFGLTAPSVAKALTVVAAATALHFTLTAATDWPYSMYVTAATVASLLAALTITYRDRTIGGWFTHRRNCTHRIPRLTQMLSHNNTAILWDHTTGHASILIEITPKPFSLNILDENGTWSSPKLKLDPIRNELRQFDIELHDLTLVTAGYTYAHQNDLAKVAFTTTGPINAIAYGRTYLRVTLDTATSANSITARQIDSYTDPRETLAAGVARTLQIASSRAHRAISLQGFNAQKLSKTQAAQLHRHNTALLGPDAIANEGFGYAGKNAPYLVAFTPAAKDADRIHDDWLRATTEPCVSITRMSPAASGTDHVERLYCNRVQRLDTVALAEASGLRKEFGQHAAIATTALPLAVPPPVTAVPKTTLPADAMTTAHTTAGGVGIYLGYTLDGTKRVWMDPTVACEEPLWIVGSRQAVELLLVRAATLGLRIDVRATALTPVARSLRSAGISAHDRPDITITALGDQYDSSAPVRIVWTEYKIEQTPRYLIDAATTPGILHVRTVDHDVKVRWEFNSAEKALLAQAFARR